MKISKTFVKKLTSVIDKGLCSGLGNPTPGEMCVEAAVCYAKGAEHNDNPTCVSPVIRSFMITLNDANWSSNEARAKGLKRLAIAQLGTTDNFDAIKFSEKMALYAVNKCVAQALRSAASIHTDEKHKIALEENAKKCETTIDLKAASDASYAARAASDASYAARAASDAARAARAASYAASDARAASDASDKVLIDIADYALGILVQMKTPGSKFLGEITE